MPSQKLFELAVAKQTAKGTAATAATYRTRVSGGNVEPVSNIITLAETGTSRLPRTLLKVSHGVDGNPATYVRDDIFGLWLYLALGTQSVAGAADPYTHTATPANLLPYFTLWRKLGDLVWEKFIDCKVAQLEFTSEAENALQVTLTIVGTRANALDAATYNTEAGAAPEAGAGQTNSGAFAHGMGSGLLLVEGAAVTRMERVAVTIANGASRQYGDSVYADDVSEGAQSITVATRERVVNAALYNRLHYGTATPATGTAPSANVLELGAGGLDFMWRRQTTPERSIRFQSGSRVQVSGIGGFAPGTGDDPLRIEPTYTILEPDSGAAFTGTVLNGRATIY